MIFNRGERVIVSAPEHPLFKYEGLTTAKGSFLRERPDGTLRVEIDGTGSQDTEGHNCYGDFLPSQVKRMPQSGAQ